MIYLQSTKDKSRPYHFDTASAMFGAIETGQDYKLISFEEVESGKFDNLIKSNLFVGSTEFMTEVFKRIGLERVGLPMNSVRVPKIMSLGDAFKLFDETKEHIFIKPIKVKQFSFAILDGSNHSHLKDVKLDTNVYVYPVFKKRLVSEWRIYVKGSKMVDSKNYSGDWTISPDYNFVNDIISNYELDLPTSYTLDIGIFEDGENVDIEFNDMWAIGNYGVPNDLYLSMLKERYFDIVKK